MPPRIDLTGQQYGKLTVIRYIDSGKWLCRCECGRETLVHRSNLRKGHTKSCGCLKGLGLIGKTYGDLKVISNMEDNKYLCKCKCGNTAIRTYKSLAQKNTVHCCDTCKEKRRQEAVEDNNVFIEGTQPSKIALNKQPSKANKSGVVGVNWDKSRGKWQASIRFKGHKYNLGRFENIDDAIEKRKEAEEKIFGNFLEWYNKTNGRK